MSHPLADRSARLHYLAQWQPRTPAHIRAARRRACLQQMLRNSGVLALAFMAGLLLAALLANLFAGVPLSLWFAR